MALLADSVKIPLSHFLRMPRPQLRDSLYANRRLIQEGVLRIDISNEYPDPESYVDDFRSRAYGGSYDAGIKLALFSQYDLQISTIQSSRNQEVVKYKSLMKSYVLNEYETGALGCEQAKRLIGSAEGIQTKEAFDAAIKRSLADPETRRALLEASNAVYFTVGATSEGHIATSNSFYTSARALDVQKLLRPLTTSRRALKRTSPVTSALYDPLAFETFLEAVGAIETRHDLELLTVDDILSMRSEPGFRHFMERYKQLAVGSSTLANLYVGHAVEQRYKGIAVATVIGIMVTSYLNAILGNTFIPDEHISGILQLGSSAVELAGFADFGLKAVKAFGGDVITRNPSRICHRMLKVMESSIAPLSYAAKLVKDAVNQHK